MYWLVRNKPIDILYINIADQTNSIVRKYSDIEQFIRDKIKEIFGDVKLNKKRYGDKKEIIADIQIQPVYFVWIKMVDITFMEK